MSNFEFSSRFKFKKTNPNVKRLENASEKWTLSKVDSVTQEKTYVVNDSQIPISRYEVMKSTWEVQVVMMVHISGSLEKFQAISDTWFKESSPELNRMLIAGERISSTGLSSSPAMGGAWETTKKAFATALRVFPFSELFCKFDDDTYVYTRELIRKVRVMTKSSSMYWGYPMRFNSRFMYGSGGAGYVLNRQAAMSLLTCSPPSDIAQFEDVAVGYCMHNIGVVMEDLIGLHPHHPYQMIRWDKYGHPADRVHQRESVEGYMNPLTYHYMLPVEMLRMHDNIHLHGFPLERSTPFIPRVIHQFWEGGVERKPEIWLQKCREVHGDWEHIIWDNDLIRERFPSKENNAGYLLYDGVHGELVNQNYYNTAHEKNLLSDIIRYEVLMFFGGMYIDADTECFRPADALFRDNMGISQGVGFLEKDQLYMDGLLASGVIGTYAFSPLSVVLVSQLQMTDWSQPPWISAGPKYFTLAMKQFKLQAGIHEIPQFFDVVILDSVHVYPYHHSDQRPENLYHSLLQKGSVMDQKWGTTHNSYVRTRWDAGNMHRKGEGRNQSWLTHYMDTVHPIGLSTLAKSRPRWVVADIDPLAGMCNRIMHILSTMVFAMASGRVLLFDWKQAPAVLHANQIEYVGHSYYDFLFEHPGIQCSLENALQLFGPLDESISQRVIKAGDSDFLKAMRWSDIDSVYPESIIRIERYDWWGVLLISNELYRSHVFNNRSSSWVFSSLFRTLFRPKVIPPVLKCDWYMQHRSKWERKTAPLSMFVECGKQHGMGKRGDNVLLSDKVHDLDGNPYISHVDNTGCRNSMDCDKNTVNTIYQFSSCSHAVLTATSTFGTCVSGLGLIDDVYIVKENGECIRKEYVDPVDAGVLDTEDHVVSKILSSSRAHDPMLAFVYMMIGSTESAIVNFQQSIISLQVNFNERNHYPVVLFVDDASKWQYLQFVMSSRLHLVEIDPLTWMVGKEYDKLSLSKSTPKDMQLSRYAAGFMLSHSALERFEYVVRLDSDVRITGEWLKDPLKQMHLKNAKLGYWVSYSDKEKHNTTETWDAFVAFVRTNNLIPKQPELLMDSSGNYLNTKIHNCFVGFRVDEFRNHRYRLLFNHFDALPWFVSEQTLYAFYIALYFLPSEVEFFEYISIEHPLLNRGAARMPISSLPINELIDSISPISDKASVHDVQHTFTSFERENDLRLGCGQICNDSIPGHPSKFFDFIKKEFSCKDIWENPAIDQSRTGPPTPLAEIPSGMLPSFTYNSRVPIRPYVTFFDQVYLGSTAEVPVWDNQTIDKWAAQCSRGTLEGTYGRSETSFLLQGLHQIPIMASANVLVIGSENPWVEACVLSTGAAHVTTLEYGRIESRHPKVSAVTPHEIRGRYTEFLETFDVIVTFSSVEHAGLGRYGDALNPWGDRQTIARAWCASKPGGYLLLAVPYGNDAIEYNAHRIYGQIMYPHLVANWHQLWRANGGDQRVHLFQKIT